MAQWRLDAGHSVEQLREVYEDLKRFAVAKLEGYLNDNWLILDLDLWYRAHLAARFPPGDGIHLGNEQQSAVAGELSARVFPHICGFLNRMLR